MHLSALFILLSLLAAAPAFTHTVREQLHDIENYVVYYSDGRLDDLAQFDLAILQPEAYDADELSELKSGGTLTAAYLSVGEAEDSRDWFSEVEQEWILGQNPNWGSYYVDANQDGWRRLMIERAGEYLTKGFDGLFLDTVDTVDLFSQTTPGMLELIYQLRETYPDAVLIQNRGFTLAEQTASQIDAIMFEDLSTSYDFTNQRYIRADNSAQADYLVDLRERTGIIVLALDYAAPDDIFTAGGARAVARHYGFIPAVSVINLNDILTYGNEP